MRDNGYIIRSRLNPKMILCTDGEFHAEIQVGPGGWCAKVYKTERGARNAHHGLNVDVHLEWSK